MAGHIAGLGYSLRVDTNGRPLAGWRLYIYETGTSTPASVYQDYSLSTAHSHPIEADSSGVMQMFWVGDGTYRVRGTDANGIELFDDDGIVALGPSSGTGGGGSSVSSEALFNTGDLKWKPIAGAETGWVRCNGRTIGSAASGGTERANSDCEELFLYLWNNFSNSLCPVTGGRGGSAAADWAANKVIAVIDMRSRLPYGLDDMGNTNAGVTSGSTSAGAAVGASTVAITVAQANLPNVNLTSSLLTLSLTGQSTFSLTVTRVIDNGTLIARDLDIDTNSEGFDGDGGANALTGASLNFTESSITLASSLVSGTMATSVTGDISGNIPLGGSGTAISTTIQNRARVGTWYIKL